MKKRTKVLLLVLTALLLMVATVFGTLAYLTSQTEVVKNTFSVGNVKIESLDEAVVDEYGVATADRTATGNNYKLIAGHTYTKDPTVTIANGSEKSYVRMIVKITDLADLKAACGVAATEQFLPQYFVGGWDNSVWVSTNVIAEENNAATYEFRYYDIVDAREAEQKLPALFTTFTMPEDATNDQIAALADMTIEIEAHAIQADGFDTADAAWGEFVKK